MLKHLSWIVGVVLVANAGALAFVALNSGGAPDATLQLTEREMRLSDLGTDTTGMTLTLRWDRNAATPWLDRVKLASLGFDCSVPTEAPRALDHYSTPSSLPRATYVVFSYDTTPALVGRPGTNEGYPSRLTPVDAGNDPRALRARYADRHRYLITAGTVGAHLIRATPTQPARLQGGVLWIDPIQVYVPQQMQQTIVAAIGKDVKGQSPIAPLMRPPRYEVTVEYGSRWLPRIVGVKALASSE